MSIVLQKAVCNDISVFKFQRKYFMIYSQKWLVSSQIKFIRHNFLSEPKQADAS